jgi:hypothetical protein
MRIKIIMFLILGISVVAGVCFAQSGPSSTGSPAGSTSCSSMANPSSGTWPSAGEGSAATGTSPSNQGNVS